MKLRSICLVLVLICAGCTRQMPSVVLPSTPLPVPPTTALGGDYSGLAWPDAGLVVQSYMSPNVPPTYLWLFWVNPDGSLGDPLPLFKDPAFVSTQYKLPRRLPDGRLSMLRYSHTISAVGELLKLRNTLEVYDDHSQQTSVLIEFSNERNAIGGSQFAWAPDMRRAFATNSGWLGQTLFWWTVEDGFSVFPEDVDIGEEVAWSPDGTTLAYDEHSLFGPSTLYLLDADTSNKRILVAGCYSMVFAWSPDGKWIAFSGTFDRSVTNDQQIWLVNPQTGERIQLTDTRGWYDSLTWSPDSHQIAAVWRKRQSNNLPSQYIVKYDLPSELWK